MELVDGRDDEEVGDGPLAYESLCETEDLMGRKDGDMV